MITAIYVSRAFVLSSLLFLVVQQNPSEDYPGQHNHAQPPPNRFCSHNDPNPVHRCNCKRMGNQDDLCETASPDAQCKSYCWENAKWIDDGKGGGHWEQPHCHCPIVCEKHSHP